MRLTLEQNERESFTSAGTSPPKTLFSIIYPYTNIGFPSQMANMIQTLNTCDALARTGRARVSLILRNSSGWSPERIRSYYGLDENPAFELHSIPLGHSLRPVIGKLDNLLYRVLLVRAVRRIASRSDNVVIYARDASILALLASAAGLGKSARFAFEAHNIVGTSLGHSHRWYGGTKPVGSRKIRFYASLERRALKRAEVVFALTHRLKEMLADEHGVRKEKIFVVPDAARRIRFDKRPAEGNGHEPLVGYVGQLFPSRGVHVLIRAMQLLDSSVKLLIVGGSSHRNDIDQLSALARAVGVGDRVTFSGFVEPSRVGPFLSRPDVLVMPLIDDAVTRNFASSMKQFEYMAARRPIVASDLPSTREILRHRETAILVQPDSPAALAEGISLALNDRQLAHSISEAAYREVNEKYTFPVRAQKIISALEEVCNRD